MITNWSAIIQATLPETVLEVTALLVLLVDIAFLRRSSHKVRFGAAAALSILGIVDAAFCVITKQTITTLADGMIAISPASKMVELGLLGIAALCLLFTLDEDFTDHVGEYVALMLFATIGGMLLASTLHLLVIFLALELLSLSLYILTAFNKRGIESAEAALKYFLFGGMSAAMLLFGFSLLYGFFNSCNVAVIASAPINPADTHIVVLALLMVVIGFAFKIAAAPLHWWAPDVYQGAPAPSAMFISSASKLASFYVFFNLLPGKLAMPMLLALAVISMVWGNLAALAQTNVRRLLGYSAIAHSGYILLAFLGDGDATHSLLPALIFYVLTYSISVIGAFAVAAIVERQTGGCEMADFVGLSKRSPLTAFSLLIFVLSMAGIPPLAGFFAKFNLFALFWQQQPGLWWLVALAIAMSAVSLYYYLQVLKQAYVTEPDTEEATQTGVPIFTQLLLLLCALAVIALGCFPQALLGLLLR